MNTSTIVKREMASQRRHFRISAPLYVKLQGGAQRYETKDWSVGGFCIQGYTGSNVVGSNINVEVEVTFSNFNINFVTDAEVVRADMANAELAATFTSLTNRQVELLKHFSDSIIMGEMSPVGETIQRIDIPVTLVSEKPDSAKQAKETPLKRRSTKTLAMSAAYIAFGLIAGTYAVTTLYSSVFSLRVETASIVGQDNLLKSSISGTVDEMYVASGQEVGRNEPLFYIRDDETLESIEMAKIRVQEAESALEEKRQQLESQRSMLQSYKLFGADELSIATAKVSAIRDKLTIAERRFDRASKLNQSNLYSDDLLDTMEDNVVGLKADLKVAVAEKEIAARAIREIDNGRFFTDNRLEGEEVELRSAVKTAEEKVAFEKAKLELMENRKSKLMVMAPVDGKITSLYANQHQLIEKGDPLLVVEGDGSKEVEMLVAAKEFEHANLKKPAKVYIGGKSEPLEAFVSAVDRKVMPETTMASLADGDVDICR